MKGSNYTHFPDGQTEAQGGDLPLVAWLGPRNYLQLSLELFPHTLWGVKRAKDMLESPKEGDIWRQLAS